MACRFGSPDLVTSLSGTAASPTFAFDFANSNYLGVSGSFTSNNGAVCSFPTRYVTQQRTSTYAITPVIITVGRTTTCSVLAPPSIMPSASGSTTYSGFECPSITDNQFAPGTYTLRFNQPNVVGAPTISSRTFIVASPTFSTDRKTTTVLATATAPSVSDAVITYIDTTTLTIIGTTGAGQTLTQTVTGVSTATTTITDTVSSCTATAGSASSLIASSTVSSSVSTPTAGLPSSENGQCGSVAGQTCAGTALPCCSLYGYCGGTDIYCLTTEGCQTGYGNCTAPSQVSSSSPPTPTSTVRVSIDGTCGGANGYVCPGSGLGDCCSPYGWCGSSDSHCGAGCQNAFGICPGSTPIGTAPLPTSTLRVSLDGACGGTSGQTCLGSNFGPCCSEYFFCGAEALYCTGACQPAFGTCNTTPAKRSAPKGNLRAAHFAAARRSTGQMHEKRAGGAGPDYTYPPVPRTTITSTATQTINVIPTAGGGTSTTTSILTTTMTLPLSGSTVTTTTTVLSLTTTETVRSTQTICPSSV